MPLRTWPAVLSTCIIVAIALVTACSKPATTQPLSPTKHQASPPPKSDIRTLIAKVAAEQTAVFEDTKRLHNDQLRQLFDTWIAQGSGDVTAEAISEFNGMLNEHGLTTFDDFLAAETTPLREVRDPASGGMVPVFGALGSDVINPWLAAVEVIEGKPLDEQPNYRLACNALREHIDFALIGTRDPNLSFDLLPEGLRKNAKWAYGRLNPTNKFDGGFDHGLFYATVREAAKKLFRRDYPQAKLTMADVVIPEARGGFGVRSCLLCHDRSHSGIYKRLLAQHLHLEAKAAELKKEAPAAGDDAKKNAAGGGRIGSITAKSKVFLRAAKTVLETSPGKIDDNAVRQALATVADQDVGRLKPGYDDFYATLKDLECAKCHHAASKVPADLNPATFQAFTLHPSAYNKAKNIRALVALVDFHKVSKSKLIAKPGGEVAHKGGKVTASQTRQLEQALNTWLVASAGSTEPTGVVTNSPNTNP